jgi:predicted membrane protein|tara:strand:+ start:248 stop:475 length:228 start_codon:yes stop_codon:yes gene_type:complete
MKIDRYAMKESLSDVAVGIIIALPVSYIVLNVCKYLEVTLLTTSIIQTTVFTLIAIIRKYIVRITFKKGELDGNT